jgi:hypothetical protein
LAIEGSKVQRGIKGLALELKMASIAELVADCPRCGASKVTFDFNASTFISTQYGWKRLIEAFCVCRHCKRSTVFLLGQKEPRFVSLFKQENKIEAFHDSANKYFDIERVISLKDQATFGAPEYVPEDVANAFNEGATCFTTACFNAAGTMFRLAVDLATRKFLPPADATDGPNAKTRRDLGLRLPWLFDNKKLPEDLRDLSHCIKEDGNDGAHAGNLGKEDAEDILDFTSELLKRLYTEPKRVELAKERRDARRQDREKASSTTK